MDYEDFTSDMDYDQESSNRGARYANAYGDYKGGYGGPTPRPLPLGQGYGPRGPPLRFGPPPGEFGMGPPGPPAIFGRGFGPKGPPRANKIKDDRAIKYLIRCGMPKENLKGLTRDFLDMIEPQYCGLCGQSFDSFSISRLHYLSKNHLKNQKKWLSQSHAFGPSTTQETPFRARELYCELCDVQITSKAHADSHYAGRSHKAIVIGNKGPKNPVLLQRGMERRVQLLIRREKRFLNLAEESKEPKPKEAKALQPDLYCDICKTSVTCSEQMTAHMNGKRHLNKEKQYILKKMRGEPDNEAEGDEGQEGEGQYGQGEGEGDNQNGAEATENDDESSARADTEWEQSWD